MCCFMTKFNLFLSRFDGKDAPKPEDVHHFWNFFINEGSKVDYQCLSGTEVAQYSSINQLLVYNVVKIIDRIAKTEQRVRLDMWIACSLALCALDERKSHLHCLPTTGACFQLS